MGGVGQICREMMADLPRNDPDAGGLPRVEGLRGTRRANSIRVTIERGNRGVAQSGSASALGAEGRGFESLRPDQNQLFGAEPLKPYPFFNQQLGYILYRSLPSIKTILWNQVFAETVSPVSPQFTSGMAIFKAGTPGLRSGRMPKTEQYHPSQQNDVRTPAGFSARLSLHQAGWGTRAD